MPSLIVKEIGRRMINRSLETYSVSIARRRRDMCAGADDARLQKFMPSTFGRPNLDFAYKAVEELGAPQTTKSFSDCEYHRVDCL